MAKFGCIRFSGSGNIFQTKVWHTDRRTLISPPPLTTLIYKNIDKRGGERRGHAAFLGSCRSSLTLSFWVRDAVASKSQNPKSQDYQVFICWASFLILGWPGGAIGRASKDPRFEPRKTHLWEFFRVKYFVLTRCRCVQPPCVYARIRMITYAR